MSHTPAPLFVATISPPDDAHGADVSVEGWRFSVELAEPVNGIWGISKWGLDKWGGEYTWMDLTSRFQGGTVTRGTTSLSQRPQNGTASFQLSNEDDALSPWKAAQTPYFTEGSVIRCGFYCETGGSGTAASFTDTFDRADADNLGPNWIEAPDAPFYDWVEMPMSIVDGAAVPPLDTHDDLAGDDFFGSAEWNTPMPGNQYIEVCLERLSRLSPSFPNDDRMRGQLRLYCQGDAVSCEREELWWEPKSEYAGGLLQASSYFYNADGTYSDADTWDIGGTGEVSPWPNAVVDGPFCLRLECDEDGAQRIFYNTGTAGATTLIGSGTSISGHTGSFVGMRLLYEGMGEAFDGSGGFVEISGGPPRVLWVHGGVIPTSTEGTSQWRPRFTGTIETISDENAETDAARWVNVTAVETLADLAKVDDPERPVSGNGEHVGARAKRLADAANWRFYYTGIERVTGPSEYADKISPVATMQATNLAQNRLSELYLTSDSTDMDALSGRKGELVLSSRGLAPTYFNDAEVGWDFTNGLPVALSDGEATTEYTQAFTGTFDLTWLPCVNISTARDNEGVLSGVSMARVGGTQYSKEMSGSRAGRSSFTRNDLICRSDATVQTIVNSTLDRRHKATTKAHVELDHSMHPVLFHFMSNLDLIDQAQDGGYITTTIDVWRQLPRWGLPGIVMRCQILGYTDSYNPLRNSIIFKQTVELAVLETFVPGTFVQDPGSDFYAIGYPYGAH
jgi:hypothetical protein